MQENRVPFVKPDEEWMGRAMIILSTIRNVSCPVLIVCILGDGLCIFMVIHISRKRKAVALQASSPSEILRPWRQRMIELWQFKLYLSDVN